MKKIFNGILPLVAILVVISIAFSFNWSHKYWKKNRIIEWDVKSYYAYLPAIFIYNDLTFDFMLKEENKALKNQIWPVKLKNGSNIIMTSTGMSYMYLPFFIVAHYTASYFKYPSDGYSSPYRLSISIAAFLYFLLGLFYLKRLLQLFFNNYVTSFVILLVGLGTNLIYYATYEAGMSHVYNFTLITIFTYYVIKWYDEKKLYQLVIFSVLGGLITLIRPTNILIYLILFLWDVQSLKDLKNRTLFFINNYKITFLIIILYFVFWIPQMWYWYHFTGSLLYFSYGDMGGKFFFDNPFFIKILFSYRKGWFVYTPIMFFALIGLIIQLYKKPRLISIGVFFVFFVYVISSWWSWWYGGSFGNRAFIDIYGIMAIPLAYMTASAFKFDKLRFLYIILSLTLVWFNTFQISQYNTGAIHYWGMTKEMYWETFLKPYPTTKYYSLVKIPDYSSALKGNYREISISELNKPKNEKVIFNKTLLTIEIEKIKNNKKSYEFIQKKAIDSNISVDSMLIYDVKWLISNSKELRFENEIYNEIDRVRQDSVLYHFVEQKAKQNNISIDIMLYQDVKYSLMKQSKNIN